MKKLFSILLCGLLLYNVMGFPLVYWIGEYLSTGAGNAFPAESLPAEDTFVLKIPVMVPYQTDWQVAEPAEGRLRRGNEFYQIVEQQLLSDTLYVKCKLDPTARERYFDLVDQVDKHVKGGMTGSKNKTSQLLKNFLKDYLTFNRKHLFFLIDWISPAHIFGDFHLYLSTFFLRIASPPPR